MSGGPEAHGAPQNQALEDQQALDELIDEIAPGPIEPYIEDLATSPDLPVRSLGACTLRFADAAPALRAMLARAASGEALEADERRLLFRGVHILGGRRDTEAYRPLLRLLRRDVDDVEELLGDALTETLPKIIAGVFDGDAETLFESIADPNVDEFVAISLFVAVTFLTWEGRIPHERTREFLERFDDRRLVAPGSAAWWGWHDAIARLGLRDLAPRVERARLDGRLGEYVSDERHFWSDVAAAEAEPDSFDRLAATGDPYGYIEDILVELERFFDPYDEEFGSWLPDDAFDDDTVLLPVRNPYRDVGRNDPCPCGSGKKAKKCCLVR